MIKNDWPQACLKLWRPHLAFNGILVFLPSAGRHNGPKFTRATWHQFFPDICVLAIADPTLSLYPTLHGGWFLHKEKGSILPHLAEAIQSIALTVKEVTNRTPPLVFAGSSMGGYASLVLATLTPDSFAFVECPQVNLIRYADSKTAIDTIFGGADNAPKDFINVCTLIETVGRFPNARILQQLTDSHHAVDHVDLLKQQAIVAPHQLKDRHFTIQYEHTPDGPDGHEVISAERFVHELQATFHALRKAP